MDRIILYSGQPKLVIPEFPQQSKAMPLEYMENSQTW